MKFKKTFLSLLSINMVLGLVSCDTLGSDSFKTSESEGSKVFHKKDIKLNNMSIDYTIPDTNMTTYFAEGSDIPYISVSEFIDSLTGYYVKNYIRYTYNKSSDTLILSTPYGYRSDLYCSIDCANDIIKTNDMNFFYFVNSPEGIDYDSHFKFAGGVSHPGKSELSFDLKRYDFNSFSIDGEVYLPLSIYNNIFLINNIASIFYNGNEFYFYGSYLDENDKIYSMRNKSLEGKAVSDELVKVRQNELYFILDYYYGLKDHKNIKDFKLYLKNKPEIYNKLISSDAEIYEQGLLDLLITTFDDPHTNMGYKSFYNRVNSERDVHSSYEFESYGERTSHILTRAYELIDRYKRTFLDSSVVRFEGNTAFIKFDSFDVGRNEEIYNKNGSVKEDAWKYDTFFLMKKALDACREDKNIKNVVIDLSTNGGGVIASCYSALGFLTDKDILTAQKDMLSKEEVISKYKVDTDLDGDYEDKDAYTEFNYYVLASNFTFSAANYFTSICKDMGIATIIGEQSGGGMCGVSQAVLSDGTTFTHSGTMGLSGFELSESNFKLKDIEDGVSCDHKVSIENFYNLKYLNEQINNGFKN